MSFHMTWRSLKGHWSGLVCSFGSACCSAFHGTSVLQPVYLLPCLLHLANVWALTLGSPSEECGSYLRNTDGHEACLLAPHPLYSLYVCLRSDICIPLPVCGSQPVCEPLPVCGSQPRKSKFQTHGSRC